MLTVKLIYQLSHREVVIPATSVEYAPPKGEDPTVGSSNSEAATAERLRYNAEEAGLLIHNEETRLHQHLPLTPIGSLDYRDVFVMNDNGSTVARYVL